MKVGDITTPLVEAWKRFGNGNATRDDFAIIVGDMLEFSLRGTVPSFAAHLAEYKDLAHFPLFCSLVAAKQEMGARIVAVLDYSDDDVIRLKKAGKEAQKRTAYD